MSELETLRTVLNNAIEKMESDKSKIVNAIEYIKLEAQENAFREIINYINQRQQLLAQEEAEKEKTNKKA